MNPEITGTDRPLDAVARDAKWLDGLADLIQPTLRSLLEGDGPGKRAVKDVLHGLPLGHPLHPPLTDVPIGAWSVAAIADLLDVLGLKQFRATADHGVAIGVVGALGAAVTGLADWSDTKDEPRRLGMLHALLNTGALSAYGLSLIARKRGARSFGRRAAFAGYAVMATAAFIGGELSFGLQLGVKHTSVPLDPPADFVPVLPQAELTPAQMRAAKVADIPVLVTRDDAGIHAVSGVCTHRGAPLAEGAQEGDCVRCPWHGSRFRLRDGTVAEGPATFPLERFETRTDADGTVLIRGWNPD